MSSSKQSSLCASSSDSEADALFVEHECGEEEQEVKDISFMLNLVKIKILGEHPPPPPPHSH